MTECEMEMVVGDICISTRGEIVATDIVDFSAVADVRSSILCHGGWKKHDIGVFRFSMCESDIGSLNPRRGCCRYVVLGNSL